MGVFIQWDGKMFVKQTVGSLNSKETSFSPNASNSRLMD